MNDIWGLLHSYDSIIFFMLILNLLGVLVLLHVIFLTSRPSLIVI